MTTDMTLNSTHNDKNLTANVAKDNVRSTKKHPQKTKLVPSECCRVFHDFLFPVRW